MDSALAKSNYRMHTDAIRKRMIADESDKADIQSREGCASTYPELAANAALVLLAVACSLLDRQLAAQAKAFETEGGFTERLYRVRSEKRSLRTLVHCVHKVH